MLLNLDPFLVKVFLSRTNTFVNVTTVFYFRQSPNERPVVELLLHLFDEAKLTN